MAERYVYPNAARMHSMKRIPTGKTEEPEGAAPIFGDYREAKVEDASYDVNCSGWGDNEQETEIEYHNPDSRETPYTYDPDTGDYLGPPRKMEDTGTSTFEKFSVPDPKGITGEALYERRYKGALHPKSAGTYKIDVYSMGGGGEVGRRVLPQIKRRDNDK